MAQLSQQQDWSHMFQVFQFNVAYNFTAPGVRLTWLLCYFVNKLTCMGLACFREDFKHIWFLKRML